MNVLKMTRQRLAGMSSDSATGLRVDGEKGAEAAVTAAAADAAPGS